MENCPYCQDPNPVPRVAIDNVMAYGRSTLVATTCCRQPINVRRIEAVRVSKSSTDRAEDNWGTLFK